jgi:hypothetical protein
MARGRKTRQEAVMDVSVDEQKMNQAVRRLDGIEDQIQKINDTTEKTTKSMQQMGDNIPDGKDISIPSIPDVSTKGGISQSSPKGVEFEDAQRGIKGVTDSVSQLGGESSKGAAAISGMIGPISDMKNSISQMGAAGAIAAAAMVAMAIAADKFGKAAKERAKDLEQAIELERELQQEIADGTLTTEKAQARIEELNREREIEQELLDKSIEGQRNLEASIKSVAGPFSGLIDVFIDLGKALGVADDIKELDEQVENSQDTVQGYNKEIEKLTKAMDEGALAANDARKELLDNVETERELAQIRRDALEGDAKANEARRQAIQDEQADIAASIKTLEESGDTSQEVQDEIKALNEEMDALGKEAEVLSSAEVKAAEATKALAEESEELAEQAAEAAKAEAARVEAVQKSRDAFNEFIQSSIKLENDLAQSKQETQAKVSEFDAAFTQTSIENEKKRFEMLNQIAEDARNRAKEQAEAFDFIGAARTRKEASERQKKLQKEADAQEDINRQAAIREREQLVEKLKQEEELRAMEIEAEIAQQQNILMTKEMAAQQELAELDKQGREREQLLSKQGQQQLDLAAQIGEAQIDIAAQTASAIQQVGQGMVGQLQGLGGTNIGQQFNGTSLNFPNISGNIGGSGNPQADFDKMVSDLIAMSNGLR